MVIRFIILLWLLPALAYAGDQRAHKLYDSVRCPTCIAQSVKESNTIASEQIREFIDHRVERGDSDDAILAELQKYYGPEITFKPGVNAHTIMLWLLPLGFLVFAVCRLVKRYNNNRNT